VLSFGNISCRAVEQRSDFNRVWRGVDLSRMFFGDEDDVDSEANHPVAFLAPCVTRRARHSLQAGWLAHTCLVLLPVFARDFKHQS
jgi:hypothetical protein